MAKVVLSSSNVFVTKVMELRVLTMYRFYLKSIILWNIIILISCNDENDFIRDYFVHRKVAKVVGFSCYDATGECDEKKKKNTCAFKIIFNLRRCSHSYFLFRNRRRQIVEIVQRRKHFRCDIKERILDEVRRDFHEIPLHR